MPVKKQVTSQKKAPSSTMRYEEEPKEVLKSGDILKQLMCDVAALSTEVRIKTLSTLQNISSPVPDSPAHTLDVWMPTYLSDLRDQLLDIKNNLTAIDNALDSVEIQ